VDDVSIFVLAGGRSSRMGSDKALLPIGDVNLLQLTLAKAREVAPKTVIVGNRERYAQFGDVIEDIIPGCGPLSGIHAALSSTGSELNLILSVDMPLMSADFLRWLLQTGAACDELAIVPQAQGRTQPLCSVFRRVAQNEVERALRAGEYKVDRLFSIVPTRLISASEWRAAGFSPDIFRNVNTPPEYEAVVTELEELPTQSARSPHS
jgi:molybdopterin-guanine dinucleotide biosynthesis protein A